MRNRPSSGLLICLLSIAGSAGFTSGCASNPVTGTPDLVFMTEAKEIELGNNYDNKVREQYGVYSHPALQAYVEQVGQQLAAQSHRSHLKYHFTVLDSPEVNAFALPGGHIYITRGILAYLNSEAELAAVLGHEIGHVTARHGVRQHAKGTATGMVGAILGAATGIQATQDLFNLFGNAILSGYGREHELESDRLGAEYMARAGYDPQAVIKVIGVLKNQEEFEKKRAEMEKRPPRIYHGVFASHPSADKRLQEVVAEADKFKTGSTTQLAREPYFKQLDNLAFGDSRRNGIRRGNHFYHADLDIALEFPDGWRSQGNAKGVEAVSPDMKAVFMAKAEQMGSQPNLCDYVKQRFKLSSSVSLGPVEKTSVPSCTGVAPISQGLGKRDARVSAVFHRGKAISFLAMGRNSADFAAADPQFLKIFLSLHPLTEREKHQAEGQKMRIVKARAGDSFAKLAQKTSVGEYGEATLRLINGKYPDGEPQPGELIKIVE